MEQIFEHYNESVGDVVKLKKKIKRIRDNQPVKVKKPTYEEGEDGWIKVHAKKIKTKKKQEKPNMINFYSFEAKEAKLQKHKDLLAKFEEDKKKLNKMREQRKFKI